MDNLDSHSGSKKDEDQKDQASAVDDDANAQSSLRAPKGDIGLTLGADTVLPLVAGKWCRTESGDFEARFNQREMSYALDVALATMEALEITPGLVHTPRPHSCVKIFRTILGGCRPASEVPEVTSWIQQNTDIPEGGLDRFGAVWLEDWKGTLRLLLETYPYDDLDALGLLASTQQGDLTLCFRRHRLLFPFWTSFLGRTLSVYLQGMNVQTSDENDRYLNPGSSSLYFNSDAMYDLIGIDGPVSIFLCRNIPDTIALSELGLVAVGIIGKQGLRPEWVGGFMRRRYRIFIAHELDSDGQSAAKQVVDTFVAEGLPAPVILPINEGMDVIDYFRTQGLLD